MRTSHRQARRHALRRHARRQGGDAIVVLLKLGGSVLTDKTRYRTARASALRTLAREVASCPEPVVLVHGAGSFGHVLAKRHDLSRGGPDTRDRRIAFAQVLHDVRELDALVRSALLDAGVPAIPHATLDLATLSDGVLARIDLSPVVRSLASGFTPVLRGDGCLDERRGFGILSGDVLMVELAKALKPSRAVFATDVDGIFDKDPRSEGARLIDHVDPAAPPSSAGDATTEDVTGGMRGKLERALAVARAGTRVLVVNGLKEGRVADAIAGRDVVGTRIG